MTSKYAKEQPADFVNRIEKIAIVGAGGRLGKWLTEALIKTGKHTVTAITRPDSTSELPEGVVSAKVDYADEDSLVEALKGQQVLIITMSVFAPGDSQSKLARAAAKAGVPYVIPNVWGYDPREEKIANDIGFGARYSQFSDECEALGVSKWIAIANGFWYEFSLGGTEDRYGFDFKNRSVVFFDDGNTKINTTTFAQVGRAVASFLSLPILPQDENDKSPVISNWENNVVFVSSFLVSQKDMFESVKRVTDTTEADWKISYENIHERFTSSLEGAKKGDIPSYVRAMYSRLFFPNGGGDYETSLGLQNDVLGLPKDDLDEATKEAIRRGLAGIL